ncbi:hypothetical protein COL516b_007047 [Colletotrichum fioriniae]|nr:uncharacterized protein COL516b_007047 [Colletotrichum fioriniae]KAJ0302511.1 hypothetical protein COL516b_007047 [Colletotrichum fioriniae]
MIIGQLFRLKSPRDPANIREIRKHLLPARLVCQRWNSIATEHLYQTLELAHTGTVTGDESGFEGWNKTLDLEAARNAAQRVIIQSCSKKSRQFGDWEDWKNGEYDAFTSAMKRIKQLPNIRAIEVHFSEKCKGWWSNLHDPWNDVEPSETRLDTLKAVFEAIRERAGQSNAKASTIRTMTIRNLQNMPHQEFVNSGLFKDVAKDIDHRDTSMEERLEFESHLQRQFLPHFAANLTALTLNLHDCWGTMPGYFDGQGLEFPRLRTLNLGNFVISNNRHFDWVLSQKSLQTLRLDSCHIVSHIQLYTDETEKWNIHAEDWQRLPKGSYGISSDDAELYRFDGTWESTFDKIRNNLPYLKEFRFDGRSNGLRFLRPSRIGTVLHPSRYINFDAGICPSPWLTSNSETGEMEFGDYQCSMNRSEETRRATPERSKIFSVPAMRGMSSAR